MSKQAVLTKRVGILEVISGNIQEREPDPHKGEGEVCAYINSEGCTFVMDLPGGIQYVPIAIDSELCQGVSHWLPKFLIYAGTTSIDPQVASIEQEFGVLANRWHEETDCLSSPWRITGNETYLKIISMGRQVIPLILEDLKERGGHWYRALRILSDENPVPVEAQGDVEQMKRAWLQWGRERGYII